MPNLIVATMILPLGNTAAPFTFPDGTKILSQTEATLSTAGAEEVLALFGPRDQNVRKLRKRFDVDITSRDGKIRVRGTTGDVGSTVEALEQMRTSIRNRGSIGSEEMDRLTRPAESGSKPAKLEEGGEVKIGGAGRKIRPRTPGQAAYVDAIRRFDLTFAIGPAGCGKTYLAVATAVESLRNDEVKKIVSGPASGRSR